MTDNEQHAMWSNWWAHALLSSGDGPTVLCQPLVKLHDLWFPDCPGHWAAS